MAAIQHALIMAAGRGKRMMPLTQALPKPMAPYRDSTLIAHGIGKIRRSVPYLHVTVGYKGAMLAQHLIEHGVSSVFNTDGRPNSWWIYHTLLRHLNEPVVVLTCDNVTDLDFGLLAEDYFAVGQPACMLVPVRPVDGLEGDYIFHHNNLVSEISRTRKADIYCSGIQVLNPHKVAALTREEGDFYSVWRQLIERSQLVVSSIYPKNWFSVDTLGDLERLHHALALHPVPAADDAELHVANLV
jgi:NDP-sugar pyrophosphorylase family protein